MYSKQFFNRMIESTENPLIRESLIIQADQVSESSRVAFAGSERSYRDSYDARYKNRFALNYNPNYRVLGPGAGEKDVENYVELLIEERVVAPLSSLSGVAMKDGNIFNPYIHRTYLPSKVLRILVSLFLEDKDTCLENYAREVLIQEILKESPPRRNYYLTPEALGHTSRLNADGTVKPRPFKTRFGNTIPLYPRWCSPKRIVFKMTKFLNNEIKTVRNMQWSGDINGNQAWARYGMTYAELSALYPTTSLGWKGDYCIREDDFVEKSNTNSRYSIEGFWLYVWVGLWGTLYAMKSNPEYVAKVVCPLCAPLDPSKVTEWIADWDSFIEELRSLEVNTSDALRKRCESGFFYLSSILDKYWKSVKSELAREMDFGSTSLW